MIAHAILMGIVVMAWTFDELYGRDSKFLDGLEELKQNFVGEVPRDTRVWLSEPAMRSDPHKQAKSAEKTAKQRPTKRGRPKQYPRLRKSPPPCEVQHLLRSSSTVRKHPWKRYRIKDTDKGPELWEVKWTECWRQDAARLPRRAGLIMARNVLTGEVKYFLSNQVPLDEANLRGLLRVAFSRCSIEQCFHVTKDELGLDHYQLRGWQCLHRHFFITQLTQLFCARVRQQFDDAEPGRANRLTVEQVRAAADCWLSSANLPKRERLKAYEQELQRQRYHRRRNLAAQRSHVKTRLAKLRTLGVEINDCPDCQTPPEPDTLT